MFLIAFLKVIGGKDTLGDFRPSRSIHRSLRFMAKVSIGVFCLTWGSVLTYGCRGFKETREGKIKHNFDFDLHATALFRII